MQRISLNGSDWQFKDFYGEDWNWRNSHKPASRDVRHWRTGSVPGSVHHDLWVAGEIPDPYFERNSLLIEWIPARTWIYKKTFAIDEGLRGKRIQLHFEGVDYEAQFFLNGERLGEHLGMYTPAIFDVSAHLNYGGENLIAVVIEAAPHEQPQVSRTSKVRHHKSRMTYWWDFCPRMIHIGIWDDVRLEVTDDIRVEDICVRSQLSNDFRRAGLTVSIELDSLEPKTVEVETLIRFRGDIIAHDIPAQPVSLSAGRNSFETHLTLDQPHLWWPNGYGDQPPYVAEVIVHQSRNVLEVRSVIFGIRRVEWIANEGTDPTARPYTCVVNGRKIYINGWNWVPIDVMYGVPRPEKLDHLLTLAKNAHVNMLRVWGGGLIEKEAFYNRCDELGIMVWQEFIQSSSGMENTPSDDPDFIAMIVHEAEQIIPRKRNHPSLVIWGGGNELSYTPENPLDDEHPLMAALKQTVSEYDPDRYWLPTSPTGRQFLNSLENIERDPTGLHDVHGPWEYQGLTKHYELYNAGTSLLNSEFGVEGITNLKALNATIAPENQWPATLDKAVYQHRGAWWNWHDRWQEWFGGDIQDIVTLQRATQFLQAEGLRYAVEANRRRWPQNSGSLPWQFNEPYPNATCTSAVDYYGQPKAAYYAVKQAYEPIHVSAKYPTLCWAGRDQFEAEIWVSNSTDQPIRNASLSVYVNGLSQGVGFADRLNILQNESVDLEANSSSQITTIAVPLGKLEDQFFLEAGCWGVRDTNYSFASVNRYIFSRAANLAPLIAIPVTRLAIKHYKAHSRDNAWIVIIINRGDSPAMFVWLEDARPVEATGYAVFSDNHFCLLPGEATHEILVTWHNVPESERRLRIGGWNTESYIIS